VVIAIPSSAVLDRSAAFLEEAYSRELALFPFSSSVGPDGGYVHDYGSRALRYTINSFLGLQESSRAGFGPDERWVDGAIDDFLGRRLDDVTSPADLGLLLVLLRERPDHPAAAAAVLRLARLVGDGPGSRLPVQTLAWMQWGLDACASAGSTAAARVSDRLFATILEDYVHPGTLLPRHSSSLYRRNVVSFGAIVYFLRAVHEHARRTGDATARALFRAGVARMIEAQGPQGEWPWLYAVATGRPAEIYPVYAVHQDSMAMLFLLPALDQGVPGVRGAMERSLAWAFGANELGRPMYVDEPFRAFRSITRTDRYPRAGRYLRAVRAIGFGRPPSLAGGRGVRVNEECRSYHPGWILYAWSSRPELFAELAGADAEPARPALAVA
jgi:hypothetical protein